MNFTSKIAIVATLMTLIIVVAMIAPSMTIAASSTAGAGSTWSSNCNPKVKYGISGSSNNVDISRIHNTRSVLPWPVVKYVAPDPAKSGQKNVRFDIYFEYPFPGTTANIADTLPAGYVVTGPYCLDGKPITPSRKTGGFVQFNKVPSPSYRSPTGVRHIWFFATAPKVKKMTIGSDTATAQFFSCCAPYGPTFYYTLSVTTCP